MKRNWQSLRNLPAGYSWGRPHSRLSFRGTATPESIGLRKRMDRVVSARNLTPWCTRAHRYSLR